jgi:uncharacterized protein involved in exopolysaccharide biosynthesis
MDPRAMHTVALHSARELFLAELRRFTERTAAEPAFRARKTVLLMHNHDLVERRTLLKLSEDELSERIQVRREEARALDAEIEALEARIRAIREGNELCGRCACHERSSFGSIQ